jgi:muramoyltetrapeptide carboxypeptidase LdcA involved in peptidoglycan recycling
LNEGSFIQIVSLSSVMVERKKAVQKINNKTLSRFTILTLKTVTGCNVTKLMMVKAINTKVAHRINCDAFSDLK